MIPPADHRHAGTAAVDPHRRAALEEERDLLLRSLDELDDEHRAGELDEADHETLRDGYTARAATVLRLLGDDVNGDREGDGRDRAGRAGKPPLSTAAWARGRWRAVAVLGVVALFSVAAGLLLARAAGERGVNDQLTGGIDESPRDQVLRCQELGSTSGDLLGSLQCFDEILVEDPANAEALSYRGWYLILATGVLQQSADSPITSAEADELVASGLDYLDRAVDADPTYPDPLAFRAALNDRLGDTDQVCADLARLRSLDPPEFFLTQTADIASRNGC